MKHADGINGNDYALCGVTLDGDPSILDLDGQMPRLAAGTELIECDQCRAIIRYCRHSFREWRGNFSHLRDAARGGK